MALVENDPSARVQFRRLGELRPPGSCYVCGSGVQEKGYLDFNTFVDFYGNFYLCVVCFEQCCAVLGWISPEEALTQVDVMEQLTAKVDRLEEENNEFTERLAVFNSALASIAPSAAAILNDVDAVETSADASTAPTGSASGESEPEEPVKIPGRRNSSRSGPRNFTSSSNRK